ncbi:MarR family transcriptional regulator [Natrarchaeobius oligotrophus]|uniref:MarR family transcriptional regulator n=1 Tax=Natrarchaeobius oligotrophus TaxID=3455743 RepID=UPI001A9CBB3C|nr:helix-turn-helix domain-containing protein [Natrarchaeobius chitinivorans]
MNEDYDPTPNEDDVIEALHEGRVTPKLLKERTDLNDQQINYALNQLIAAGWVRKVTTGLYELKDDPREHVGDADEVLQRVVEELENIEAAFERGDPDAARDALERAQEAISDGDPNDDTDQS